MKIVPSNLSPSGWAALVLAGGCLLAIPFFKRPTEQYAGVEDMPARKTYSRVQANSNFSNDVAASNQTTSATTKSASSASAVRSSSTTEPSANANLDIVDRVSAANQTQATSARVVERPSIARASIDTLPPPAGTPNLQSSTDAFSAVAPLNAEFPEWAKKPSLLDSVLSGKDSSVKLPENAPARKPSSFHSWADQSGNDVIQKEVPSVDRHTPFGSLHENASLTTQNAESKVQWPDEDPRAAVPMPKPPERLVGRDAVIRDPALLAAPQNLPNTGDATGRGIAGRAPAVLSSSTADRFRTDAGSLIVQPQFGQNPTGGARSTASLRKHLPPDDQMIIRQPRLK
ncbi:MAG: hypothetical protein U0930_16895 [Pirellulales bacterium]